MYLNLEIGDVVKFNDGYFPKVGKILALDREKGKFSVEDNVDHRRYNINEHQIVSRVQFDKSIPKRTPQDAVRESRPAAFRFN